jgi:2-dehydropantoate 2-reductase
LPTLHRYRRRELRPLRILVLGTGVIGSVYAGKLEQNGHEVVLLARGQRLLDLRAHGLILQEAVSGERTVLPLPTVSEVAADRHFDLVLVPVRSEQLNSTLPVLTTMTDVSDVLFFGNTVGRQAELTAALGNRALFGFPAVGGVRDGSVVKYVLINQQKTMLGESSGKTTPRVKRLQGVFNDAGFSTKISADIDGWLLAHAAFVVPLAVSLYRAGVDAARLSSDSTAMRLMVLATRQAFAALRSIGNVEIPTNLRILYSLPIVFGVAYWRKVLASPRGELWFAAHCRAAPEEMRHLAEQLQFSLSRSGRSSPDLDRLLTTPW